MVPDDAGAAAMSRVVLARMLLKRNQVADASGEAPLGREQDRPSTFTPFSQLADLLKRKT